MDDKKSAVNAAEKGKALAAAHAAKTAVVAAGNYAYGLYNAALIAATGNTNRFTAAQIASANAARATTAALIASPWSAIGAAIALV